MQDWGESYAPQIREVNIEKLGIVSEIWDLANTGFFSKLTEFHSPLPAD